MLSATFASISSWIARNFEGFVAGILTAFGIATLMAVLVMRREAVGRGVGGATAWVKRAILGVLRWLVAVLENSSGEVVAADKLEEAVVGGDAKVEERRTAAGTSVGDVVQRDEKEGSGEGKEKEIGRVEEVVAPRKREKRPFELRERLFNEPPEGFELRHDYAHYECYDTVQKEFKDMGGKDLEWKTSLLDLDTESSLLNDYCLWAGAKTRGTELSKKERTFYQTLSYNLRIDHGEIRAEHDENNRRHGKTEDDANEMWKFMDKIRERERRKKRDQ